MKNQVDYPLFITRDINPLADVIAGHADVLDLNALYSLSLLSEGLVLANKIALPSTLYSYFSKWDDRFCTNIDEIFIDANDMLGDIIAADALSIDMVEETDLLSILKKKQTISNVAQ